MKEAILLIPSKPDKERDAIANVWQQNGGIVQKIGKFWIRPNIGSQPITLYGNDTFCLVLAQLLEIELISPKDEFIAAISFPFVKRNIETISLQDVEVIDFPKFIKPVIPKQFKANVFSSLQSFLPVVESSENSTQLIVSEIIEVRKEVRAFILNGVIQDFAFYEGTGNLDEPRHFINSFLSEYASKFPPTFVIDIGYNPHDEWFVLEFNASWGAGLNGCQPQKVIESIQKASKLAK